MKCGGEEALERAISRGDVVRSAHKGREAYFFPMITVGESEEIVEDQRLIRKKGTTTTAFETVQGMLDTMGWAIKATERELKAERFFEFLGVCLGGCLNSVLHQGPHYGVIVKLFMCVEGGS